MEGWKGELSGEQALLVRMTGEFSRAEIAPRAAEMDEHPEKNDIMKIISQTAELGMLAALLPQERGGQELGLLSFLLALAEMARESAAVAAVVLSHNLARKALDLAGMEPPSSGNVNDGLCCLGMLSRLEAAGEGGAVSGGCDFIPGLMLARRAVLAEADGELVSVALEGGGAAAVREFDHGLRAARPGALELDAAAVEQRGRLEEAAADYLLAALCLGVTAISAGIASKGAEASWAYARERYQGGALIVEHQQLRVMMGGMRAVEEAGMALLRGACGEGGDGPSLPAALAARALVGEAATGAASDAVQLHGGYGYMRDYGLERLMRDASSCRAWPFSGQEALLRMPQG